MQLLRLSSLHLQGKPCGAEPFSSSDLPVAQCTFFFPPLISTRKAFSVMIFRPRSRGTVGPLPLPDPVECWLVGRQTLAVCRFWPVGAGKLRAGGAAVGPGSLLRPSTISELCSWLSSWLCRRAITQRLSLSALLWVRLLVIGLLQGLPSSLGARPFGQRFRRNAESRVLQSRNSNAVGRQGK